MNLSVLPDLITEADVSQIYRVNTCPTCLGKLVHQQYFGSQTCRYIITL
jgi:hypothetical protein